MRKKNGQQQYGKQLSLFPEQVISLRPTCPSSSSTTDGSDPASIFYSLLERNRALTTDLLEEVLSGRNLTMAYHRVVRNGGSGGIDGMGVEDLSSWLATELNDLQIALRTGTYMPSAVLGVEIPKSNGGKRLLGIPTVVDRFIQQSIHQQLNLYYDPLFSEHSYGFRPNRSAHQAIQQSSEYVKSGNVWVVDIDLANFFDKINHDRLMQRLSKGIGDKCLLHLIRKYLTSDLLLGGMTQQRISGSPQGGPLSPLLSNIVLDELDKELEKRGHLFVRYADDCNIYVRSKRAGERVLASVTRFIEQKLKLKVNVEKSGVRYCDQVKFLGYTILPTGRIRIADKSIDRFKKRIRTMTKRNRGVKFSTVITELNTYTQGWVNYYHLSNSWLPWRALDGWIRRRLRCYRLKQCGRKYTLFKYLRRLGVEERKAWNAIMYSQGWYKLCTKQAICAAMGIKWFKDQGLYSLASSHGKWLKD